MATGKGTHGSRLLRVCPVLAYAAAIWTLSSFSDLGHLQKVIESGALSWLPFPDKFAHATIYGGFALAVANAIDRRLFSRIVFRPITLVLLICATYGAIDEFHQSFVPNRTPDFWDLTADVAGAAAALLIVPIALRWLLRPDERENRQEVPR